MSTVQNLTNKLLDKLIKKLEKRKLKQGLNPLEAEVLQKATEARANGTTLADAKGLLAKVKAAKKSR